MWAFVGETVDESHFRRPRPRFRRVTARTNPLVVKSSPVKEQAVDIGIFSGKSIQTVRPTAIDCWRLVEDFL
jgi:hypothetical protein